VRAFKRRGRGEAPPDPEEASFDLRKPSDLIIAVIAAVLLIASAVWLIGDALVR
jgi:hypothetical protein